jgi:hypothetical protein
VCSCLYQIGYCSSANCDVFADLAIGWSRRCRCALARCITSSDRFYHGKTYPPRTIGVEIIAERKPRSRPEIERNTQQHYIKAPSRYFAIGGLYGNSNECTWEQYSVLRFPKGPHPFSRYVTPPWPWPKALNKSNDSQRSLRNQTTKVFANKTPL